MIAPPGLFLLLVREHLKANIEVCAQNMFDKPNGAFTGEISAEQLTDSKIGWALAGHSERRVILGESNDVSGSIFVNGGLRRAIEERSVYECPSKANERRVKGQGWHETEFR